MMKALNFGRRGMKRTYDDDDDDDHHAFDHNESNYEDNDSELSTRALDTRTSAIGVLCGPVCMQSRCLHNACCLEVLIQRDYSLPASNHPNNSCGMWASSLQPNLLLLLPSSTSSVACSSMNVHV